jgi:hypothetical protein
MLFIAILATAKPSWVGSVKLNAQPHELIFVSLPERLGYISQYVPQRPGRA